MSEGSAPETPDPTQPVPPHGEAHRATSRRVVVGALINFLGLIAGLSRVLAIVVATRLYGPAAVGLFTLGLATVELARQFSSSGFVDAIVMLVSRHLGTDADAMERVNRAIGQALMLVLLVGVALIASVELGGAEMAASYRNNPALAPLLRWMIPAVPLMAVAEVLLAATRARQDMRWHALILGGLNPLLLLGAVVAMHFVHQRPEALGQAFLIASSGTALLAILVFSRYYSLIDVARAMVRRRRQPGLLSYALTQNANLTLNYFASSVDVLMLGYLHVHEAQIAYFYAGVQITRNLQAIRQSIALSFAPVIARFHTGGRTSELGVIYGGLVQLTLRILIPASLCVAVLHTDLLAIYDPSYADLDPSFLFVLLGTVLANGAVGLAGNIIAMTGNVRWGLVNTAIGGSVNVALNLILIPHFSLLGAAVATMGAALLVLTSQVVQVGRWLGIATRLFWYALPVAGASACALAIAALLPWTDGLPGRIALAVGAAASYLIFERVGRALVPRLAVR